MEDEELLGMDEEEARQLLNQQSLKLRVLSSDNQGKVGDCRFAEDRVNVDLIRGKIVRIIGRF